MGSWCYIVGQNIMTATAYEGGNSLYIAIKKEKKKNITSILARCSLIHF